MKTSILPLAFVAGMLLCGCATTETTSSGPVTLEQRFSRYDLDKNGRITRNELGTVNMEDAFFYFDSDGNEIVTTQEWLNLGGETTRYRQLDLNGDGQLTLKEVAGSPRVITNMSKTFATVDVNKDGGIDIAEAKAYQVKRLEFIP